MILILLAFKVLFAFPQDTLTPLLQLTDLNQAVSIEYASDETLLLLERESHQVQQIDLSEFISRSKEIHSAQTYKDLQKTSLIGGYGMEPGAFADPVSLSITAGGRFLIAERESRRLQVFDSRWISLSQWDLDQPLISSSITFSENILPDAAFLLADGQVLVVDLTHRTLHHFSSSGRYVSSHSIPEEISTEDIQHIDFDGEFLWFLNGKSGEIIQLTTRGFYSGMISCGFPAEAFNLSSTGLLCANSTQLKRLDPSIISQSGRRNEAVNLPTERHYSAPIAEPLTDVLMINEHVFLLTSRSLYYASWSP